MNLSSRSPLRWVPSLYFAMGLPFVVLNMVSAVLYKDLGISDAQIAFWTSLIMWPWTIKFLWSPFLELYRTKKFWVVGSQLLSGVLFGVAALSLQLPLFFSVSVAVFAVVAFSGATHDIAADGVYMSELSPASQAKYIGWQGAFYNLAKLVATGGLVWLAGWLYEGFSTSGTASFDAYVRSWTVVLLLLCVTLVALGLYHLRALPSGGSASEGRSLRDGLSGLREVIGAFFTKRHIWYYIAFIILYRLGEGFVMKIVPLFLKADTASGGLGAFEPADRPLLRDFRRGGVSHRLAFGGLLHRPPRSAAHSFHAVLYLQPAVRGLRLACMVPAFEHVARRRGHRRGVLRLRLRLRGPHAVYDAAGRSGTSPDGALRFRFGYYEPLGDAHGHGFGLFERSDELPDLLPRGDARHHSGFCDHPAGSLYL